MANTSSHQRGRERLEWLGLAGLFAAIYFIQGICEPTEGLVAQPVRSLMGGWGRSTADIGRFFGLLGIPWSLKLIYGLLTDLVPLWGRRRRSYLLLSNGAATLGFLAVYIWMPTHETHDWLFLLVLLIPTFGVAFADVVIDALMVEVGQPRGLTGRLQSVQWGAMSAATVVMGFLGGWLSHGRHRFAFLIAGVCTGLATLLTIFFVHERPLQKDPTQRIPIFRTLFAQIWDAIRSLSWLTLLVAAFLFLWNFNPFSTTILQLHMTRHMGFSEQFYGETVSIQALGSILACIAYGYYCRHVRFSTLVHLSVFAGVLATASYWAMHDHLTARIVAFVVGFTYLTGLLVQLELAARVSPIAAAATAFALLMAISNTSVSLSIVVGGYLYEMWSERWDSQTAYHLLVGAGALATALCWLLVPALITGERRHRERQQASPPTTSE